MIIDGNAFWLGQGIVVRSITLALIYLVLSTLWRVSRSLQTATVRKAKRASLLAIWLSILGLTYGVVPTCLDWSAGRLSPSEMAYQAASQLLGTLTFHLSIAALIHIAAGYAAVKLSERQHAVSLQ